MLKKIKKSCVVCKEKSLYEYINFGKTALAGSFLTKKTYLQIEPKYELSVAYCSKCKVSQIIKKIDENIFFKNYFYSSSKIQTLVNHFKDLSSEINNKNYFAYTKSLLEIGCNDGVLLKNFYNSKFDLCIGVDPAKNIIKKIDNSKIKLINDFFSFKLSQLIKKKFGKIDLIIANNVFAHSFFIRDIAKGINNLLSDDGVFIFEVHYIKNIIFNGQFDMIYHEHVLYYSVTSLKNLLNTFNLRIFNIKKIQIHAGSIRVYACKNNSKKYKIHKIVNEMLSQETKLGLNNILTYNRFNIYINALNKKFINFLYNLHKKKLKIAGYGASGRANTMLQFNNLYKFLEFMIDDSTYKIGNYTPGSHLQIKSSKILYTNAKPDVVIIFAWSFKKEIIEKHKKYINNGGRFVTLMPNIQYIKL